MSTAAKVLIFLIAAVMIGVLYVGANVLKIQSAEKQRVEDLQDKIEQAQKQLTETIQHNLDKTREYSIAMHGWGRAWMQVPAALGGNAVKIELGRLDGFKPGEILYAFAQGGGGYLGQFQVDPDALGDHAAQLRIFPEYDAVAGDEVEQRNLSNRIQRIQTAGPNWLLLNDLPESLQQGLMTASRRLKQQQYKTNAASSDRDAWSSIRDSSRSQLTIRDDELGQAIVDLARADDQRNVEVRARFDKREELARTLDALREMLQKNQQETERIASLEQQLLQQARRRQQAALTP